MTTVEPEHIAYVCLQVSDLVLLRCLPDPSYFRYALEYRPCLLGTRRTENAASESCTSMLLPSSEEQPMKSGERISFSGGTCE